MASDFGGQVAVEAFYCCDLVGGGFTDPAEASEVTEHRAAADWADAFDVIEDRAQPCAAAELAIVSDRKSMCLVADADQQEERGRILRQHYWILAVWQEDALFGFGDFFFVTLIEDVLLGERHAIDLIAQIEFAQHFERDVQLTLAAVDYPQVGILFLASGAFEPALEDFVHRGEIVLAFEAANPVAAIKIFLRLAFVEGDLRADDHRTLQIGDVVAFDALGRVVQIELDAETLEHRLASFFVIAARGETLARIVHRHFQQPKFLAALRQQNLDFLSAPLCEQLGAHGRIFELDRHDHFVGDAAGARVILSQQIGKNVVDRELEILKAPSLSAGELAAANYEDDGLDEPAFAVDSEHVLIDSPVMEDGLALDGLFDCAHAVADSRRFLELEL